MHSLLASSGYEIGFCLTNKVCLNVVSIDSRKAYRLYLYSSQFICCQVAIIFPPQIVFVHSWFDAAASDFLLFFFHCRNRNSEIPEAHKPCHELCVYIFVIILQFFQITNLLLLFTTVRKLS